MYFMLNFKIYNFRFSVFIKFMAASVFLITQAEAQSTFSAVVIDAKTNQSMVGVAVKVEDTKIQNVTDEAGKITLQGIPNGVQHLEFSFIGYKDLDMRFVFPLAENNLTIKMEFGDEEIETLEVTSTRTGSRIEDSPTKIEVLGASDMVEEIGLKPGSVTGILGDISSIQVQQSSVTSGNSNVRIQGLDGKYTQFLRDGLPVYDGFSGGFGVLQIPPLDLRQIEIIKGSASTLYGGGAIGGIINFISKKPDETAQHIVTATVSSLGETDFNAFYASKKGKIGFTFFGGITRQVAKDVDGDGFSDVPDLTAINLHPKLFWQIDTGTNFNLSLNTVFDNRKGGDMQVLNDKSDATHTYFEKNVSNRQTIDGTFTKKYGKADILTIKTAFSRFSNNKTQSDLDFTGTQSNLYTEVSYLLVRGKSNVVVGVNYLQDSFSIDKINITSGLTGTYNQTFGAFAQYSNIIADKWYIETGIRGDYHNKQGFFALPSVAVLYKLTDVFSFRFGAGLGYKTPNILSGGVKDLELRNIHFGFANLKAEQSAGTHLEWTYKKLFNDNFSLFFNQSFFITDIKNPIIIVTPPTLPPYDPSFYTNANGHIVTKGIDNYLRLKIYHNEIYFGYTFTDPKIFYNNESAGTQNPRGPYLPYTPVHRFGTTFIHEIPNKWRFGFELSGNINQYRDDGITKTPSYTLMNASVTRIFKHFTLVLNGENLLDTRQSKFEKTVFVPPYNNPSFATLYAPIDGRVINLTFVVKW